MLAHAAAAPMSENEGPQELALSARRSGKAAGKAKASGPGLKSRGAPRARAAPPPAQRTRSRARTRLTSRAPADGGAKPLGEKGGKSAGAAQKPRRALGDISNTAAKSSFPALTRPPSAGSKGDLCADLPPIESFHPCDELPPVSFDDSGLLPDELAFAAAEYRAPAFAEPTLFGEPIPAHHLAVPSPPRCPSINAEDMFASAPPPQAAGPPDAFALDLGALNLREDLSEADALDGRQRGTSASDDDMVMDSDDD